MKTEVIELNGVSILVYSCNTIVVGTGAAGFNAADRLYQYGQTDIAIVTENINTGTSRNTGSDKQTYYKLTLSGGTPDSVEEMAKTLFDGGCVDGDLALCEAALSTQCFLKLVEIGVPFPRNRYGEYIGYKTDHDPRRRATSVGPYTSKRMTECLERSTQEKNIHIFNKLQCIRVLTDKDKSYGLLCLNLDSKDPKDRYVIFNCKNIVYATGGPAGIYSESVYPFGHYGATGLAFEAGVRGKNLTEWQYGIASVKPRWNVSGTYMQVIPKFISTDADGNDEKEFLFDYFTEKGDILSKVFMKGYQWPFDVRKIEAGSSIIDILVYIETYIKGRRVFLDYRENSKNERLDFTTLSAEAREYLENAKATFGTPYERLKHMNQPAVDFYKERGVDLETTPLEIALCAQHNNGGLDVDIWWQTNVEGFFAVGEVSASHGIYRPGGSALNAGQVGSMRAAQYIAAKRLGDSVTTRELLEFCTDQITASITLGESCFSNEDNVDAIWDSSTKRMSRLGATIREAKALEQAKSEVLAELKYFSSLVKIMDYKRIKKVYRLYDVLICQYVYLSAMTDYVNQGGQSRGSALYTNAEGSCPYEFLPDIFTFCVDDGSKNNLVQEVLYQNDTCSFQWRKVRDIPQSDYFFENVWREFRENNNIL